ncbi:thioesterase family protein [Paralimibaculum aggregatum]|uniref:Thioesterase family protein n=1 Tax=Paralimibaculum aggregatum TaxID=3036245 RepID=A0ABQ6LJC6_9RHOB|nr:thioesterase family protein [Limibaculum sp. NKW23]GMG81772.1 thioesterase family protein [Limibaculum sp. NKW23]
MSPAEGGPAARRQAPGRAAFALFRPIGLRWHDNDVYGHVNNVVYYGLFDTLVNAWLCERGLLEVQRSPVIGLVVSSSCDYFASVAFPQRLEGGLRAERIGTSSITYGIGIFAEGAATAAAAGRFTHVMVDAATHRPVPIPEAHRAALQELTPEG